MSIPVGMLVQLPTGHSGTVLPSPIHMSGRVFIKLSSGRRRWVKIDLCTPIASK